MSTTEKMSVHRRMPPTAEEVAGLDRLWREAPVDLYGVRRRFIECHRKGSGRTIGVETVLRYRPGDLPWPTRDQRIRAGWTHRYMAMDGPFVAYVRPAAKPRAKKTPPSTVADKPGRTLYVRAVGSRSQADIDAERMTPSDTDPTPEQIREHCRQIRRSRGEIVLLEIDLR